MIQMRLGKRVKGFLLLGACVLAVLGAWLAIEREARQKGVLVDQPTESPEQPALPAEVDGFARPEGLSDEAWNVAISSHNIRKSSNREINFYGKLIDQNGDPVAYASIEFELSAWETSFLTYATTGKTKQHSVLRVQSDSEGLFSFEDLKGKSLYYRNIDHPGYLAPTRDFKTAYIYNNLVSGPIASMYHQPDKENPVIFTMWKKGEAEPLIRTGARLRVKPAEGVNETYLTFGLGEKPTSTPPENWDVKASGWLEYPESRYDDKMWEVTLTAPEGGGFILTEDLHTNLAPENGYQNTLTFKSSNFTSQELRSTISFRAYYKNPDGSKYAAFRFELGFSGRNGEGSFSVRLGDLRINPNGSRNLEFDPRKQIREYP